MPYSERELLKIQKLLDRVRVREARPNEQADALHELKDALDSVIGHFATATSPSPSTTTTTKDAPRFETHRAATVKFQPLWRNKPHKWFVAFERLLASRSIVRDSEKYAYLVANLGHRALASITRAFANLPEEGVYEYVKAAILEEFPKRGNRQNRGEVDEEGDKSSAGQVGASNEGSGSSDPQAKDCHVKRVTFSEVLSITPPPASVVEESWDNEVPQQSGVRKQHEEESTRIQISEDEKKRFALNWCKYHYDYGALARKCDKSCARYKEFTRNKCKKLFRANEYGRYARCRHRHVSVH